MIKVLFGAIRPKTLIASIAPVILSYLLARKFDLIRNQGLVYNCFFVGLLIQIATNYFNDYVDNLKGADKVRVGPKRFSGEKVSNQKLILISGIICSVISLFLGLELIDLNFWYLPLGLISLFFSYGYTGGPFPLAYLGLGELFVFIFFGLVATLGSFFALTEGFTSLSYLLATCLGLYSTILIAYNNLRDEKTDKTVGKNTLAVKLGESSFKKILLFIIIMTFFFDCLWFFQIDGLISLIILSVFKVFMIKKLLNSNNSKEYALIFPMSAIHLVLFFINSMVVLVL